MRRRYWGCAALLMATCALVWGLATCGYDRSMKQVEEGVQAVVAGLPLPESISIVTTIPESFSHRPYTSTCYYGRVYVVYGTVLPAAQAVEAYTAELADAGWVMYEPRWLDFQRGAHERVALSTLIKPLIDFRDPNEELAQVLDAYPALFYATVDYALPDVQTCVYGK